MFDRTCPSPLYTLNCNITVVKCFFPLTFTFLLLRVDLDLVSFGWPFFSLCRHSRQLLPSFTFDHLLFYLLSSIFYLSIPGSIRAYDCVTTPAYLASCQSGYLTPTQAPR